MLKLNQIQIDLLKMINADLVAGVLTVDGVQYKIGDLIPNKPVVERPSDKYLGVSVLSTGECLKTDNALNERDQMGLWSSTCEGARLIADRMQLVKRYEDFIAEQNAAKSWVFDNLRRRTVYGLAWNDKNESEPYRVEHGTCQKNTWIFGHQETATALMEEFTQAELCIIITGEVMR